jgi:hypothetical protein
MKRLVITLVALSLAYAVPATAQDSVNPATGSHTNR